MFADRWQSGKFTHNRIQSILLERIDGDIRLYKTPEGNLYPSVTTILSKNDEKETGLAQWRKRLGDDAADAEMNRSTTRGTNVHLMTESYLNNDLQSDHRLGQHSDRMLFRKIIKPLNRIDNILAQEISLYSDAMKSAGTCDCIASYNDIPSIIDFKTSNKEKLRAWIGDYFLQCTMYSLMVQTQYNIKISNLVIIIAVEQGLFQVFQGSRKDYLPELQNRLLTWNNFLRKQNGKD